MGVKKLKSPPESSASDTAVHYHTASSFNPALLSQALPRVVPPDFSDRLSLIREGVTRRSIDDLMEVTGLSLSEISSSMHITERTLRNYSGNTRLAPDPSERAIEIGLLYQRGKEVLGSLEAFKEYMGSKIPALDYQRPRDFLDTSLGISFLMEELGRLETGVYS